MVQGMLMQLARQPKDKKAAATLDELLQAPP